MEILEIPSSAKQESMYSISTVSTLQYTVYTVSALAVHCTNELEKAQMNMGPNIEHN